MPSSRLTWSLSFFRRLGLLLGAAAMTTTVSADPINWQSLQISTLETAGGFGISFATLPEDGRFVLGRGQKLFVQNTFGTAASTEFATNGITFDPSFVAVRNGTSALLGQGGAFGAVSGLHPFNPANATAGTGGVRPAHATLLQTYAAAYWKSPTSSLEGWLIGGANGPNGPFSGHNITFVSLDGTKSGAVTEELCTFSSGVATDAAGNLYAALFELDSSPNKADADKVIRFSAAQLEPKIQAIMSGAPAAPLFRNNATFVHKFRSASTLTVDALGRVWAAGFKTADVEVFDPATGRRRVLVPVHPAITGAGGPPTYQVSAYNNASTPGTEGIAVLAYDSWMFDATPILVVTAPVADVSLPEEPTFLTWRNDEFDTDEMTFGTESTLWGQDADPDGDGLSNLMEYALNTAPKTYEYSPLTMMRDANGLLNFTFVRNPENSDVSYWVEASNSMQSNDWTTIASSTAGGQTVMSGASDVDEVDEGALKRVTVTDAAGAAGQSSRFMRLRITLTPP